MPDRCRNKQQQGRLYSLYCRPWVLKAEWASDPHVPYICDLNVVPSTRKEQEPLRDYAAAWNEYIHCHVVSRHAQRMIVQFMAANCGRSKKQEDAAAPQEPRTDHCPPNALALQHLHKILDEVGRPGSECAQTELKQKKRKSADSEEEEEHNMNKSEQMHNALCATTALWRRDPTAWMATPANNVHSRVDLAKHHRGSSTVRPKGRKDDVASAQGTVYMKFKQANIAAWWRKVNASDRKPNAHQTAFLEAVSTRCQTEAVELNRSNGPVKGRRNDILSEPMRVCLFGDPGAWI